MVENNNLSGITAPVLISFKNVKNLPEIKKIILIGRYFEEIDCWF